MTRPWAPLWGNFIGYADQDFLAFGLLQQGNAHLAANYHLTQAVEKYFKALALSVIDPQGVTSSPQTDPWLRTHDLCKLAARVSSRYPSYADGHTTDLLTRLTEFDQATRYPWVEQKHGNGFTTADYPVIIALIKRLRTDLPIQRDDYFLGIEVRRRHQTSTDFLPQDQLRMQKAVGALRQLIPDLDGFVRW